MYKIQKNVQLTFEDFDQPMGLSLNLNNRWIKKAELIPWFELEFEYAKNFKNKKGNVAKPLRMVLGALLIQREYNFSDEEVVLQIQENPYFQFFIGLPGYQEEKPFDSSTMVYFRKRLDEETLMKINEKISTLLIDTTEDSDNNDDESNNSGTLILDATCAPQNIKYPTDTDLLNNARVRAEKIIDDVCNDNGLTKPRTYRRLAKKEYLKVVKRKRKNKKWLRARIRKMLSFLRRDLKYIDRFIQEGYEVPLIFQNELETIRLVYAQQQKMYDERTHSVEDRIVSISQPWIRPIVRGKAKVNVEFGAKLDLSIDEHGFARVEKTSLDSLHESSVLVDAVNRYYERTGRYPERVLVDKIYRNRVNRAFCRKLGIKISGPALGRPKKDCQRDHKAEYQDQVDRIEVERRFSLLKRKFHMENIRTKLQETTLSTILLAVLAMNIDKLRLKFLRLFFKFGELLQFNVVRGEIF